jgi:hypothetical protein
MAVRSRGGVNPCGDPFQLQTCFLEGCELDVEIGHGGGESVQAALCSRKIPGGLLPEFNECLGEAVDGCIAAGIQAIKGRANAVDGGTDALKISVNAVEPFVGGDLCPLRFYATI